MRFGGPQMLAACAALTMSATADMARFQNVRASRMPKVGQHARNATKENTSLSVEYGFSACCDESPTSREVSEIKKLLSSSEFGNHFWARPPRRFGDGTLPDSVQDDFFEEAAQSCFAAASAICLSIRCNTESSLIGYSSFFIWCSPGEI
jgi:hypothetical protein